MDRRQLLVTVAGGCSIVGTAGCLDGDESDDQEGSHSETSVSSSSDDDSGSSGDDDSGSSDDDSGSSDDSQSDDKEEDEVECRTELESNQETEVDRSRDLDGGYEWTHEYRCEDGDTVSFDCSASDGQDIAVEIDSPQGETVYSETGVSVSTAHQFDAGGSGEIRIANLGERTEEEREELWDDRVDVGAGNQLDPWVEIGEGDQLDYYVRMVDGARPKLRIEDSSGQVHREHSVSEVIDDEFTAPEDDRYYLIVENTATLTSGTWDYTFERVSHVPIPTTVALTIEREYEEEVEICE